MKKLFTTFLIALFLLPQSVGAVNVSWDYTNNILRPLQSLWTKEVQVPFITATTTATNTLPTLESTDIETTNLEVSTSFNFLGTVITNVATWFNGLFDTQLATKDTDDLAQGSSNLYNQTHSGEVTGATSLTIADNIIEEANLETTNSPTDNYVLSYDQSSGGFTWVVDATGGGGGDSVWTRSSSGAIYTPTTTDQVIIGDTSTTSASDLEIVSGFTSRGGNTYFGSDTFSIGTTTAQNTWPTVYDNTPEWGLYEVDQSEGGGMYMSGGELNLYTDSANAIVMNGPLDLSGGYGITGELLPTVDDSWGIGNSSAEWYDIYLGAAGAVWFDSQQGGLAWTGSALEMYALSEINSITNDELLKFTSVGASAVNEITIANSLTGVAPSISSTGSDTNVSLLLDAKGSGDIYTLDQVGIGTTTAAELLHLYSSTGNFTTARFDSAATQGYFYAYDGDNSVNIGANSDSILNLKQNNTTVLSVAAGANGDMTLEPRGSGDVLFSNTSFGQISTGLPYMWTYYNDSNPANSDRLFEFDFYGNNAGGSEDEMGAIISRMNSTSSPISTSIEFKSYYNDIYDDMLLVGTENGVAINGIAIGNPFYDAILTSNDANNLVLQTGAANTGNITITDGTNGDITFTPHGAGNIAAVTDNFTVQDTSSGGIRMYSGSNYGEVALFDEGTGYIDMLANGGSTYFWLNQDSDGSVGGALIMQHESASPTTTDKIAGIFALGDDLGGGGAYYASQEAEIRDATGGTEDGAWVWSNFVAGADTEVMALASGNLGIGTTSPSARLSVEHSGTGELVTYREYENGSGGIDFGYYKLSASPAFFDTIAYSSYYAYNDAFELIEYAYMDVNVDDETDGTEDGNIDLGVLGGGGFNYNRLTLDGNSLDYNSNGLDADFLIWSAASSIALWWNAGANEIGLCPDEQCDVRVGYNGSSGIFYINDVAHDAIDTDTKCAWIENPTASDDLKSLIVNKTSKNWTLTEIWGESDQTVSFDWQVDDGTPADVNGTDITPAAGEAEDTTLSGDTTLAAGEELDIAITSVSGSPTWLSACITFTKED